MKKFIILLSLFVIAFTSAQSQVNVFDGKILRSGTTTDSIWWFPQTLEDGADSVSYFLQIGFASTGSSAVRLIFQGVAVGNTTLTDTTTLMQPASGGVFPSFRCLTVGADSIKSFQFPYFRIVKNIDSALYHPCLPIHYRVGIVLKSTIGTNGRPLKLVRYTWKKARTQPIKAMSYNVSGIDSLHRSGTTGDTLICGQSQVVPPYCDSGYFHIEIGFNTSGMARAILRSEDGNINSTTDTLALATQEGSKYLVPITAGDSVYTYIIPWYMIKSTLRTVKLTENLPYNFQLCLFLPSGVGTNAQKFRCYYVPYCK